MTAPDDGEGRATLINRDWTSTLAEFRASLMRARALPSRGLNSMG